MISFTAQNYLKNYYLSIIIEAKNSEMATTTTTTKSAYGQLTNMDQLDKILNEHKKLMERELKRRAISRVSTKKWVEKQSPEEMKLKRRQYHVTYMEKKKAEKQAI